MEPSCAPWIWNKWFSSSRSNLRARMFSRNKHRIASSLQLVDCTNLCPSSNEPHSKNGVPDGMIWRAPHFGHFSLHIVNLSWNSIRRHCRPHENRDNFPFRHKDGSTPILERIVDSPYHLVAERLCRNIDTRKRLLLWRRQKQQSRNQDVTHRWSTFHESKQTRFALVLQSMSQRTLAATHQWKSR